MSRTRWIPLIALTGLALTACAPSGSDDAATAPATSAAASCSPDSLKTITPNKLTVATGNPAFPPWVIDDKPESGNGFEAAVAYAAAEKLGYTKDQVTWVRTTFDGAIAPGPKNFDWNLQQFTITEDRKKAVDFSSAYYEAPQAVVANADSSIAKATTLAALKSAKLGAAIGSTSLDAAQQVIDPTTEVQVFSDNAGAVSALKNKQIDGIVVDLPTGAYLVDAEIEDGVMVGTLPAADPYGILLAKGSPLTACTTQVVDDLRADGTLTQLQATWLADYDAVPALG